jgi:hypothetical protein
MNRLASPTFVESLLNVLGIAVGHMIALLAIGLAALALWTRVIVPAIGTKGDTIHINGSLLAIVVIAYVATLLIWRWHNRIRYALANLAV